MHPATGDVPPAAVAELRPTEGFVRSNDGVRLHYRSVGESAEAVIIALESSLSPDLDVLGSNRRLLYYDPRGRGQSDPVGPTTECGIDRDILDLEALHQQLGIDRVALIGWSYYGGVVARYAARHPDHVSRVVQIAPLPARRTPYFDLGSAAVMARTDASRMAALQEWLRSDSPPSGEQICEAWSAATAAAYAARPESLSHRRARPCAYLNENPLTLLPVLGRMWQQLGDWDYRDDVARSEVPRLILLPDGDFQIPEGTTEWATGLHARVVAIADAGHYAWLDNPSAFFKLVSDFLDMK